jgi:hypothetical protein
MPKPESGQGRPHPLARAGSVPPRAAPTSIAAVWATPTVARLRCSEAVGSTAFSRSTYQASRAPLCSAAPTPWQSA